MLLKPEPLKGLDWLSPISGYDREMIKNFQQLYSQKLLAAKKTIFPTTMLMRYLYGCPANGNLSTDIGSKTSPFRPYQKPENDGIKTNESINSLEELESDNRAKSPNSSTTENFTYTLLNKTYIASFHNEGEKLLCLPQILNLLKNVDISDINEAINSMGITCTECDDERLGVLHKHNILPKQVSCCGLISQSNAERLLKFFNSINVDLNPADGNNNTSVSDKINLDSAAYHQIRVTHDCFGQQKGIIFPLKYTHSNAQCIECLECGRMMSPADFVGHTHQEFGMKWSETEVCHWGFDSSNWRWYLRLSEDCTRTKLEEESLNDYLDEIKKRFCSSVSELPPKRGPQSSTNSQSFSEAHFKSLHLSGAVFQQCISKINSNNNLSTREEKIQLLNALFLLRQEHLQQINNLITERQQLIEGLMKKSSRKSMENNQTDQLLQIIKLKTAILKKEQISRKRPASVNSDIREDNQKKRISSNNNASEEVSSKKLLISSPLTIECCDSSGENALILDSPNTNTITE